MSVPTLTVRIPGRTPEALATVHVRATGLSAAIRARFADTLDPAARAAHGPAGEVDIAPACDRSEAWRLASTSSRSVSHELVMR